jgi:DNA-binding NarL/FixJ family response regulator
MHIDTWVSGSEGIVGARCIIDGREVVLLAYEPSGSRLPFDGLTAAEKAVLGAVLAGKKNAEIARERGRSARTVAKQVAIAMRKLGVTTRGELAAAVSRAA